MLSKSICAYFNVCLSECWLLLSWVKVVQVSWASLLGKIMLHIVPFSTSLKLQPRSTLLCSIAAECMHISVILSKCLIGCLIIAL